MSSQSSDHVGNTLTKQGSHLVREKVVSSETLHGGGLSEVVRLFLSSGKSVVVKSGPFPDREEQMLKKLADAGANVPTPIASNFDVLVLEDLGPETTSTDKCWQTLGTQLRTLHATEGDQYGWDHDYAFGPVSIYNRWSNNWPDFWFEKRLFDGIEALPFSTAQKLENLQARITEILPTRPKPSLLHGDLWTGNVHFAQNGDVFLIDPASYFGHSEVDLAMLTLFGSPPGIFWEAYGPLDADWDQRRHAYQLWPALVHFRLFGAAYRVMVERLLDALQR